MYQNIQAQMRTPVGKKPPATSQHVLITIENMRKYFDNIVALTPAGVPSGVTTLYRGIKGDAVKTLADTGILEDRGFQSYSTSYTVAREFAQNYEMKVFLEGGHPFLAYDRAKPTGTKDCIIMKLEVRDIEAGTALIWFGQKHHPKSVVDLQEVLFPPGTVSVVQGPTDGYVVPVNFRRDRTYLGR